MIISNPLFICLFVLVETAVKVTGQHLIKNSLIGRKDTSLSYSILHYPKDTNKGGNYKNIQKYTKTFKIYPDNFT